MKKLLILFVSIILVGSNFVVPVMAGSLFEVDIVPCGPTGAYDGCGTNISTTDPLVDGGVRIDKDGDIRVVLKGAAVNTTYSVFVGNWITYGAFQIQYVGEGLDCGGENIAIGTVTTNQKGDFIGPIITPSETKFSFPSGTSIGQPSFAFNNESENPCLTQFTTGFSIPFKPKVKQ